MPVHGSCHCGKLTFVLVGKPPAAAMACNCSICRRKGYLLHFSAPGQVALTGADGDVGVYQFNRHNIRHQFCTTCGCAPFGDGTGADGTRMIVVNLRCAEGIDLDTLRIEKIDGASL